MSRSMASSLKSIVFGINYTGCAGSSSLSPYCFGNGSVFFLAIIPVDVHCRYVASYGKRKVNGGRQWKNEVVRLNHFRRGYFFRYAQIQEPTNWFRPCLNNGRTFVIGTEGTLEVRKYMDPCRQAPDSRIFLTNGENQQEIECFESVGFPFFGELILDCLNRTENAMTQEHAFKAAELSMKAQVLADQTT